MGNGGIHGTGTHMKLDRQPLALITKAIHQFTPKLSPSDGRDSVGSVTSRVGIGIGSSLGMRKHTQLEYRTALLGGTCFGVTKPKKIKLLGA